MPAGKFDVDSIPISSADPDSSYRASVSYSLMFAMAYLLLVASISTSLVCWRRLRLRSGRREVNLRYSARGFRRREVGAVRLESHAGRKQAGGELLHVSVVV